MAARMRKRRPEHGEDADRIRGRRLSLLTIIDSEGYRRGLMSSLMRLRVRT